MGTLLRTPPVALAGVALAGALAGCVGRLPPETFDRRTVRLDCCGRSDDPVELTYLGVGGWVIRKGGTTVLTAPFFSNPPFFTAGLLPVRADSQRIEAHLPDVRDAAAILVGHGHYDHLMDVPYVARVRAPEAVVWGNETVGHQLAPFGLGRGRVRGVEEDEIGDVERMGRWLPVAPGVRAMPIRSDHAPHFAGVVLYSGVRRRDMPRTPRSAEEWLDGETIAWLIDLLNADGSVGVRIYYQDAVAAAPFGLIPPLDDQVGVDVALVVPATYAEVEWHPEAILENLRPRQVLLCHWEDFFEPPDRPAEPVPFTRLPEFVDRLKRALPAGTGWHLPLPGTRFLFH